MPEIMVKPEHTFEARCSNWETCDLEKCSHKEKHLLSVACVGGCLEKGSCKVIRQIS